MYLGFNDRDELERSKRPYILKVPQCIAVKIL